MVVQQTCLHLLCEWFSAHLSTWHFHFGSNGCTFHEISFSSFCQNFPNFCVQIYGLALLSTFLPSLVQSTAYSLCVTVLLQAADE